MTKGSFDFEAQGASGVRLNSFDAWGVKINAYDVFSAPKRDRKITIPFRDGAYDLGRKYYDEKMIILDCGVSAARAMTKSALRDMARCLTQKGRLYLWDEPDKYYVCELIDSAELTVLGNYASLQFSLPMLAEPFAYRDVEPLTFTGAQAVNYAGTARTPVRIELTGLGAELENITVTFTDLNANAAEMNINAALSPGQSIVYDSGECTIYKDGENIINTFNGVWLKLSENVRSVSVDKGQCVLTYAERFI